MFVALQVEALFDVIRDPAERQMAVECLTVIFRICQRNPEIHITSDVIDCMKIIRDAICQFWSDWLSGENSPQDTIAFLFGSYSGALPGRSSIFSPRGRSSHEQGPPVPDLTFEHNERIARRLFFDLEQEGPIGTFSYLAKSSVRLCFGVNWSADGHLDGIVNLKPARITTTE